MESYAYFPTYVYRDERPEWVDVALKLSQHYSDSVPENSIIEQTGHMADDVGFKFLVDYILDISKKALQSQGYSVDKYGLFVSGLWRQDVKCQGSTNVHVHRNSQICGWYFLETPEGGAYPIYHDTRMNKHMIELDYEQDENITVATPAIHFNNVNPGTVLFSNSWVPHQLTYNQSDRQTKAIHFIVSHKEKPCSSC